MSAPLPASPSAAATPAPGTEPERAALPGGPEDGHEEGPAGTRERLLREALRIFGAKGFDKASTREICQAAGANIGMIKYYFGDKQGLYSEALVRPLESIIQGIPWQDGARHSTEAWLRVLYGAFIEPLRRADSGLVDLMRVWGRELSDPTPVGEEVCMAFMQPFHGRLSAALAARLGLPRADEGVHRLGFALMALVQDYWTSADYMEALAPGTVRAAGALDEVLDTLICYGQALIQAEGARRERAKPVQAARARDGQS